MTASVGVPQEKVGWGRLRRLSFWLPLLLVLAITSSVWLWPKTVNPLDPQDASRTGAKAVARVLAEHGVQVEVVRGADDLQRASDLLTGPATLMVAPPASTEFSYLDGVYDAMTSYRHVLVVGYPVYTLDEIDITAHTSHPSRGGATVQTGCQADLLRKIGQIATPESGYALDTDSNQDEDVIGCFPVGEGHALLLYPGGEEWPEVDLLSAREVLANDGILAEDQAALALRLLSRDPTVIWYVPGAAPKTQHTVEQPPTDTTPLLPPWWGSATLLALMVTIATMLWRGRRLGRLVIEPLPVVIRANETTRSKARLYHKAREPQHALDILTEATRRRLVARLALPQATTASDLVVAVANATGRTQADVADLLFNPACTDDVDFVVRANDLSYLEKEITQP